MGKAYILLSHRDGGIQFLRKHQKASIDRVGFRYKGMSLFPVQQMADIIPNTCRTIAQIRSSLLIQKHHPTSIQIRTEIIFHMRYVIRHIPTVHEMISLCSVIQPCHQIPMGLKAAVQIRLNLSDHFLQLVGTLLNCHFHQVSTHKEYPGSQNKCQNDRKRSGQKICSFMFSLLHMRILPKFSCIRCMSAISLHVILM